MKKKKLDSLSLNKSTISRLNSSIIKGGNLGTTTNCPPPGGTRNCPTASAATPCFSRECIVQTGECGLTEQSCDSIHVHCL
ncbi:class I lanthipeptide [Aquimarina celericrescens]|uniref:Class I lanthipeptide n=1 Tax=Aquimarina celericrescens TaxID=1964542 RepID=A0ABW5AYB5_9FLAO|nr:class I lanthipeptide [Aquimarina celericrescens]